MNEHMFDRFFVYRPENFAWLTGGGDCTVAEGEGIGFLEVTPGSIRLHTSRVEVGRLIDEERAELETVTHPWYEDQQVMSPNDNEHDLSLLRLVLSKYEQERYRSLGRDAALSLEGALQMAEPNWTESRLSGEIAHKLREHGIKPVVLLVAGEKRVFRYRHPLPKRNKIGRLVMGVVCGRRDGLIANLTRMKNFGMPDAISLYEQVLKVEERALSASVPGAKLGDVIDAVRQGYASIGKPEAFFEHHQGGIAGYLPREILATPGDGTHLARGMCVAWNPSLAGAKVEDTCLITDDGLEVLTCSQDWPTVMVNDRKRPAMLLG